MNELTLCLNSKNPNEPWLNLALETAQDIPNVYLYLVSNSLVSLSYTANVKKLFIDSHNSCKSVTEGYNFLINQVQTEWVSAFADDDYFVKENLKELLDYMTTNEIKEDIIHFTCQTGKGWCKDKWEGTLPKNLISASYKEILHHNQIPFSCFYRKKVWERVGGYDPVAFNDWHFWQKALKVGFKIKEWNKPVYFFRKGAEFRLSDIEDKRYGVDMMREEFLKRIKEFN